MEEKGKRLRDSEINKDGSLRIIERRFSSLIMATTEVVYQMNPDWTEMLQLNSQGFLSNTEIPNSRWLQDYIPPEDQKHVMEVINEAIKTKSVFELEHRVLQKDGDIGWTFSRAIPILDDNGNIIEWFGVANDITEKKNAEKAIRESEEKYRTIFETMTEGFSINEIICDKDGIPYDYRYISVNPAYERYTGLKPEEIIGKTRSEIFHGIGITWLEKYRKVALTGETARFEEYFAPLDGWLEVLVFRIKADQIGVLFSDISKRKRAEEQIRKTKEQYDLLFNSVSQGFALYKAIRDENGTLYDIGVLEINPAGATLSGCKRDDQIGKTWLQIWGDKIPSSLFDVYRKVDISGEHTVFEHFSPITNRWYTNSINKIDKDRFTSAFFDITELKKVETELNEALDNLEIKVQERTSELQEVNELINENAKYLNIINRAVIVANGSKDIEELAREVLTLLLNLMEFDGGGLYLINEKEKIAEIVYSQGLSEDFIKCIDDIDINLLPYKELLIDGKSFFLDKSEISKINSECLGEYDVIAAVPVFSMDKIIGSFNLAGKNRGPVAGEEKNILNSLGREIGTTITKLIYGREMERLVGELKRSNADLQHFAYIASHDLQEPLRTITSFTQLLVMRYREKLDNDAVEFMDLIVDASTQMKQMITDLLEYSRTGTPGVYELVDTDELVNHVLLGLKDLIERNKAEVTFDPLPALNIGKDHLQRVFQNLIGNAIKFRKPDEPPKVHISSKKNGNEYIFSVSDNGIGIEEKYFERIFTIFQRLHTKDKYEGTGIGLTIIKRIINSYKGRIWIESSPGIGSTFYFTVPVDQESAA